MAESKLDDNLTANLGKSVLVKLKNGMEFRGIFQGFDDYINIVINDAVEIRPEGDGRDFETLIFKGGLVGTITPVA